jgi:hypothetical protein
VEDLCSGARAGVAVTAGEGYRICHLSLLKSSSSAMSEEATSMASVRLVRGLPEVSRRD